MTDRGRVAPVHREELREVPTSQLHTRLEGKVIEEI
jgi:hypothetical protein